jgi:hypothetical protein
MVRNRLLKDEAIDRPDLLLSVFVTCRFVIRIVGVMVRVR